MKLLRILFLIISTAPFFVFAQTAPSSTYQDAINKLLAEKEKIQLQQSEAQKNILGEYLDVKTSPPIPAPDVPVTITIESYLTDLYKANISWSVDGKILSRGLGRTSFTFQNGKSGKTTTVSVIIITNTGERVSRDFYFKPLGVTIMWEADTYTPPFYRGKAMMVPQANIRIVATPDTKGPLETSDLVYTWRKDEYVDPTHSGYGKNSFSFAGPKPLTNTKIALNVSSLDSSAESEMQIYLPQIRPFVLFYEKDPLLGTMYNKPIGSAFSLDKKELSVSAEPYFFSNERGDAPSIKYAWQVNGKSITNYGRVITLRNDGGEKGKSLGGDAGAV